MSRPFWSIRVEPAPRSPAGLLVWGLLWLGRWAALGTLAAVGFGVVLGLILGIPRMTLDIAFGGAAFGLAGGPVFGVLAGLISIALRGARRGRAHGVKSYAYAGAGIFALVPFAIGFARHGELMGREGLGEVLLGTLFAAGAGAAFGAIFGAAMKEDKQPMTKPDGNGWTELEL